MNDIYSSARLAFEWLVGQDAFYICPDDEKLLQRYVVSKLYFQQEGDSWLECSNSNYTIHRNPSCNPPDYTGLNLLAGESWLSSVHECDWAFITCNDEQCITKIEVDENDVGGTLVNEIDNLPMLEVFTMDGSPNHIDGTIPTQFGNLPALRVLDLDENGLTGTIPEEIYNAILLEQFDLDSNFLTGTLSSEIGTLQNLWFVQLFNNTLTGPVPQQISNLVHIHTLNLHMNDFTGEMPIEVCDFVENGDLEHLWADCSGGNNAKVVCSCCSQCF